MQSINRNPVQFMHAFNIRRSPNQITAYFEQLARTGMVICPPDLTPAQKDCEVKIFVERFITNKH